jgi:hypothetical protein
MSDTANGDTAIWWWLGSGVALLGGVAYASYKAAQLVGPQLLEKHAPELVPHYEGFRRAKTDKEKRAYVREALGALAAQDRERWR